MSQADQRSGSAWAPLRRPLFRVLWVATLVSNIGTWMQNAAAGWLMTELDPAPLMVALVQVATSAPLFLFALPAGALADILDRRRLLIATQIAASVTVAVLAVLVAIGWVTPLILLAFTFVVGIAAAVTAPSLQAIVPQLVPRDELPSAVALSSVGLNISRAVGPALAGAIIGAMGLAAPFWVNAVSNLGVIAALIWWRSDGAATRRLPPESFPGALRTGLRHARYNPHLRATLMHAAAFFLFASAYWALLPLVARQQVQGGPGLYGILLGTIGAGAVIGALLLPRLKRAMGPDALAMAGTIGTAAAMILFGLADRPATALAASAIAGTSWIAVLSTINVSAQVALPAWVRGRGLAIFVTVQFGGMTFGSLAWGQFAAVAGLTSAPYVAAAALLVSIPLLRRWKLQTGAVVDLAPSMHWPAPAVSTVVEADRGPVLVTVEYRVNRENRDAFLEAIGRLAPERRRDGAYDWGLYEDAADESRYVETFHVDSWLDHLRQHERVTNADRQLQDAVRRFLAADAPRVTHLIAARFPGFNG